MLPVLTTPSFNACVILSFISPAELAQFHILNRYFFTNVSVLLIRIPANLRSLIYYYGIANGGQEEWDFAFDQLLQTSVASERKKLVQGLAGSPEPWILSR